MRKVTAKSPRKYPPKTVLRKNCENSRRNCRYNHPLKSHDGGKVQRFSRYKGGKSVLKRSKIAVVSPFFRRRPRFFRRRIADGNTATLSAEIDFRPIFAAILRRLFPLGLLKTSVGPQSYSMKIDNDYTTSTNSSNRPGRKRWPT